MMDKQTSEEKIMSLFRETWLEFPKGKLVKTESPDFILRCSRKKSIGIELTQLDGTSAFESSRKSSLVQNDPSLKRPPQIRITKTLINATIRRKEEKLPLYRSKMAGAYYLIITAGEESGHPHFRISQNAWQWQHESEFQKVFLFIVPEKIIIELK